jgi:hypothetical protein
MGNLPQTLGSRGEMCGAVRLGKYARDAMSSLARDDGQGLVEYSLILILVSIVAVPLLDAIGLSVTDFLSDAANDVGDI